MKELTKAMHEAYVRAHHHLGRLSIPDCDDDEIIRTACFVCGCQSGWTLGGELRAKIGESLFQLMLDDNRRGRLMKMIAALNNRQANSRERVLIAYKSVIHREGRLPFVRELRADIAAQLGRKIDRKIDPKIKQKAIPDEKSIRFILHELSLPVTSRPGRPKKTRK
jgi:hypothetical protein